MIPDPESEADYPYTPYYSSRECAELSEFMAISLMKERQKKLEEQSDE